jgi:hypothetical protein
MAARAEDEWGWIDEDEGNRDEGADAEGNPVSQGLSAKMEQASLARTRPFFLEEEDEPAAEDPLLDAVARCDCFALEVALAEGAVVEWSHLLTAVHTAFAHVEFTRRFLNLPECDALVRRQDADGDSVLFNLEPDVPDEVVELLLFMGAPRETRWGVCFYEARGWDKATKARSSRLEQHFLAVTVTLRDALASRLVPELFPILLPYVAGCVPPRTQPAPRK